MEVTLGMADMKMGNSAIHKPNRPTVQKNQKSFTQMAQDVMVVELICPSSTWVNSYQLWQHIIMGQL